MQTDEQEADQGEYSLKNQGSQEKKEQQKADQQRQRDGIQGNFKTYIACS